MNWAGFAIEGLGIVMVIAGARGQTSGLIPSIFGTSSSTTGGASGTGTAGAQGLAAIDSALASLNGGTGTASIANPTTSTAPSSSSGTGSGMLGGSFAPAPAGAKGVLIT